MKQLGSAVDLIRWLEEKEMGAAEVDGLVQLCRLKKLRMGLDCLLTGLGEKCLVLPLGTGANGAAENPTIKPAGAK